MNNTIFNLNHKMSIIIVSIIGILLGFLSNAFYIGGILSFIFYIFRCILFIGIFGVLYLLEKKNTQFKSANKRMMGYLGISAIFNVVFSIFVVTHLLGALFITLSGIVCFWVIFSFVIEILNVCLENSVITKILSVNEKIGLIVGNPIAKVLDNLTTNG